MAIIDAVNRWLSALNAHDGEAIVDAIAPGGTYLEPTLESPIDNEATGHLLLFPRNGSCHLVRRSERTTVEPLRLDVPGQGRVAPEAR